jgi:prepilin-type processing-associated H-X9-DG protein
MHSWRVLILPHLGHTALYRKYRLNEPWDGPTNSLLLNQMPDEYRCPSLYRGRSSTTKTSYLAVVGQHTMWPNDGARKLHEVTDGVEDTLMVVEAYSREVNWMQPRDINFSDAAALFASRTESRMHLPPPHPGGFNMLYADGHAGFGVYGQPSGRWKTMLTVNAGDTLPETVAFETDERPRWRRMAGEIPYGAFVVLAAFPLARVWLRRRNGMEQPEVNHP